MAANIESAKDLSKKKKNKKKNTNANTIASNTNPVSVGAAKYPAKEGVDEVKNEKEAKKENEKARSGQAKANNVTNSIQIGCADHCTINQYNTPSISEKEKLEQLNRWNFPITSVSKKIIPRNQLKNNLLSIMEEENVRLVCHGFDGMGKTTLIYEYAQGSEYKVRAWFSLNEKQIEVELFSFAKLLGFRGDQLLATFMPFINKELKKYKNWLLIFDYDENEIRPANIKKIIDYFDSEGHIIINYPSNFSEHNNRQYKALEVGPMLEDEALDLFVECFNNEFDNVTNNTIDKTNEDIIKLVHDLGCMPFAIKIVGAYFLNNRDFFSSLQGKNFKWNNNISIKQAIKEILNKSIDRVKVNLKMDKKNDAETKDEHEGSAVLLNVFACLNCQKIPKTLLYRCFMFHFPNLKSENLKQYFEYYLDILIKYDLISKNGDSSILCMHSLVQEFLQESYLSPASEEDEIRNKKFDKWFELLLKAAHEEFSLDNTPAENESRYKLIFPHLQMVENLCVSKVKIRSKEANIALGHLCTDIGFVYLYIYGMPNKAKEYYVKAYQSIDGIHNNVENYLEFAAACVNLGNVCYELGESETAIGLLEQAYNIYSTRLGEGHFRFAITLMNLANAYHNIGKYDTSITLQNKALIIFERFKLNAAIIWNNLAATYLNLDRIEEAKKSLMDALPIFEQQYNKEHVQVADVLFNLGLAQGKLDEIDEKIKSLEQCLQIYYNWFGESHLKVIMTLNELEYTYNQIEDNNKKISKLQCALTNRIKYAANNNSLIKQLRDLISIANKRNVGGSQLAVSKVSPMPEIIFTYQPRQMTQSQERVYDRPSQPVTKSYPIHRNAYNPKPKPVNKSRPIAAAHDKYAKQGGSRKEDTLKYSSPLVINRPMDMRMDVKEIEKNRNDSDWARKTIKGKHPDPLLISRAVINSKHNFGMNKKSEKILY